MRPLEYVEAPPVTPLPFGLFSAALVTDDLTGQRQFGVGYQHDDCGTAYTGPAVCDPAPDFGALTAAVDTTRGVLLNFTGQPAGVSYRIQWGDGDTTVTPAPDTAPDNQHVYDADGVYSIVVTDGAGLGYRAAITVTVTNGAAVAAAPALVGFSKIVTEGIPETVGDPFVAYSLLQCAPMGGVNLEERVRRNLQLGEQRAVERFLAAALPTGAVDVRPGTAVTPVEGVAILEQWAAAEYGGVPVIHAPRGVASVAASGGGMVRASGRLETSLGSLIAAGGGYAGLMGPGGTPPGADEAWLYVTGTVTVRRAPEMSVVAATMRRAPEATNDALTMAERPYVVATECIRGAVLVSSKAGQIGALGLTASAGAS